PPRERDAGHHGDHVAQHRDLADESIGLRVAEVNVQLAPARRRVAFRHVLAKDVDRLRAGDENRADVPDQRLHHVALLVIKRVRRRDRFAFLSERAVKPADDLRLPEQRDDALFERARQSEVILDVEKLISCEAVSLYQTFMLTRQGARRSALGARPMRLAPGDSRPSYSWIECPITSSAASMSASDNVGWA